MTKYLDVKQLEIDKLLEEGFVKLSPIDKAFNLEIFTKKILSEMKNLTFSTSCKSHEELLNKLKIKEHLSPILYRFAKKYFSYKGNIENQYHVVRMVRPGDIIEQYRAHFDSHIFTLVLPIKIPVSKSKERGELILYPNARRYPKFELENILGKIFFKKYANKNSISKLIEKKYARVENFDDMRPILFNGVTTLHTNKFVDQTIKGSRITILAHFFDPSPKYGIGSILRKIRNR
jgi:hypothetical protein